MTALPNAGEVFVERYRLQSVLGEGGFARVFKATDMELGRDVAIKLLKPDGPGDKAASRFAKEMKLVANVRDDHVVTMFDYGRTKDGLMYMVLELVDGRDLSEILRQGPLSEQDTLKVLRQLLAALRAVHSVGTLHRDVKPANIRVYEYMGDPWRVKLLDFGVAKTIVDDASLTATGMAVGTPQYMTPEQLYGEDLGPTTDLYSLAIVAYEMLTGQPLGHMRRLANGEPVTLESDRISPALRGVLNRMLEREPARRFATADAVLAALDRMVDAPRRPVHPTNHGRERRPATTTSEHERVPPRLILLAVLAVLTGGGAGVAVLGLSGDRDESKPAAHVEQLPERRHTLPLRADEPAIEVSTPERRTPISPTGCGEPPPHRGDGVLDTTDGLRRVAWRVHVPEGYDPDKKHPTVLLFHDDTSSPQTVLAKTKLAQTADENGFVIIAPASPGIAHVWMSSDSLADVRLAYEETANELCLDPERVFAVGHGSGSNAVARLTCEDWVKGYVMASHILSDPTFRCGPQRPAPTLWFAPLDTGFQPPKGGQDCSRGFKISYDKYESMWRTRNETVEQSTPIEAGPNATCRRWEGTEPFVSCRVRGGRPWPGSPPRKTDVLQCDGEPPDVDFNNILWDFLSSLD